MWNRTIDKVTSSKVKPYEIGFTNADVSGQTMKLYKLYISKLGNLQKLMNQRIIIKRYTNNDVGINI